MNPDVEQAIRSLYPDGRFRELAGLCEIPGWHHVQARVAACFRDAALEAHCGFTEEYQSIAWCYAHHGGFNLTIDLSSVARFYRLTYAWRSGFMQTTVREAPCPDFDASLLHIAGRIRERLEGTGWRELSIAEMDEVVPWLDPTGAGGAFTDPEVLVRNAFFGVFGW